jgi:hypothetical protein
MIYMLHLCLFESGSTYTPLKSGGFDGEAIGEALHISNIM